MHGGANVEDIIRNLIETLLKKQVDYCEVRFQDHVFNTIILNGTQKMRKVYKQDKGLSIRVYLDGGRGFAYTNDLSDQNLEAAVKKAVKLARYDGEKTGGKGVAEVGAVRDTITCREKEQILAVPLAKKVYLCSHLQKELLNTDFVSNSFIIYNEEMEKNFFANSEGSFIESEKAMLNIKIGATARRLGQPVSITKGFGGIYDFDALEKEALSLLENVTESINIFLKAKEAPRGFFDIILDSEVSSLLIHEIIGHLLEADVVKRGNSPFKDKVGERIAPENFTVVDDPAVPREYGSYKYDDEGVLGNKKFLIKDGYLIQFLHNRETAKAFNAIPTGNGRAQDYRSIPLVRNSNIYLQGGDLSLEQMIQDTKLGIYVRSMEDWRSNLRKGYIQINSQEAFLIERGQIKMPLINLSIVETIRGFLTNINSIGKDVKFIRSKGTCKKKDEQGRIQEINIGLGAPLLRRKEL